MYQKSIPTAIPHKENNQATITTSDMCIMDNCYGISGNDCSPYIYNSFLWRWLLGSIPDPELEQWLISSGKPIYPEGYTVALIPSFHIHDRLELEQKKAILNLCRNALPEGYQFSPIYDLDENIVLIFPHSLTDQYLPAMRTMLQSITSVLGNPVFIAVGMQGMAYSLVYKSYETAKKVISHYQVIPSNGIIFYSEIETELTLSSGNSNSILLPNQSFESLLSNRQYQQCMAYVDTLFSEYLQSASITPSVLRNQAIELAVYILNALRAHNLDISKIVGDDTVLFFKIFSFSNTRDLHLWMNRFLSASIEALENTDTLYSPCVARAVEYIKAHYAQGLSLKTVANNLKINAAYLGQLFKAETTRSFSVFLNEIRIENAKKLLTGTNLTLSTISQRCGYPNTSYFYNVFKKLTGQTPSQYRRSTRVQ